MAYVKYKELTQYFNFNKKLDTDKLPNYVTDYIKEGEVINAAYATTRDKCVFTDRKLILFDVRGIFGKTKRIHFFPYKSISSSAIEYHEASVSIMMSMDSGYQVRINFVNLTPEGKSDIRKVYFKMIEKINL